MRIIIAGAGEVGSHLARMLSREKHEIVIVDSDSDRLKKLAETNDLLTLQGDVKSHQILMEAGIDKASLFISVTPWDDTNIVSAIMAKKLGAKRTVVRIGDNEPLKRENRDIFSGLGIDAFVYPERIAAREVASIHHQSGIFMLVDFAGGKLSLLSLKIEKNASIVDKTVSETSDNYRSEYCTVGILRNGETIIPKEDTRYKSDDIVFMVTNYTGVRNILRHARNTQESIARVMILGGSHIGQLIAGELGKNFDVKIFEADRDAAYRLSNAINNAMVINGDGSNVELLLEEGLRTTDTFIAVTSDSETNILACLMAKNEGAKRTIAEIENINYINLAERLGIDTVINKKLIAASHIYRYTLAGNITNIKYLATTEAEALEFEALPGSKIIEKPLCEMVFPKDATIGGYVRNNVGCVASGNTWIQSGDSVVVFALPSAIEEICRFFV